MQVLVVAAHDAALVDRLRAVVHGAMEGASVEIVMALPDTPEQRLSEHQLLLWREQRCPSNLASFVTDPLVTVLATSESIDSLAGPNNNPSTESDASATASLLKRIHKRDRKIKSLSASIEELKTQLAEALARSTFVEHEQEQFFEDVQHMKVAYDKLHTSHQKLLWEYLPAKDPAMHAIPSLSHDVGESEQAIGPYVLSNVLGYGQYAAVFAAYDTAHPHEPLAVKAIDKEKLIDLVTLHRVNSEIASLRDPALQHSSVLALRDVIHTPRHIYLVTERGGKDLFEYFGPRDDGVAEETIKKVLLRVALAVETLHRHNYCHRDLKPENILYDPDHASPAHTVKLVDFGLCTKATTPDGAALCDFCGSPGFFAPEILLAEQYDGLKADVWSLGCILLELVVGNDRFATLWMVMYELETLRDHAKFQALVHSSLEATYAFCHSSAWTYSVKLRSLLLSLLEPNPQARPTVAQTLEHAWFHDALRTHVSRDVSPLPMATSPRGSITSSQRSGSVSGKPELLSAASFNEGRFLPTDHAGAHSTKRPVSAERDAVQLDHGSPHVSVLLAAATPPQAQCPPLEPSSPTKPATPKLSLPSLSPEKPTGARSPDKTFAKRAATPTTTATTTLMPPTRSASRYDDDDDDDHAPS